MSISAFQTQYRQEFIQGFEQRQSLVRQTVTTEVEVKGNQAVFLVADSNHATAVSRGLNGNIPARASNLNQFTVTLQEWNYLERRTAFNLFASQGDGRHIMQMNTTAVLNRKIDQDVIAALSSGTLTTGASSTGSLDLATYALAVLGNNEVEMDGNISALITPAYYSYLMRTKEFTNVQYVNNKPFESSLTMFRWANINWIVHPNLPGKGTNAEKCFVYHKSAIGHAINTGDLNTAIGYDEEQDYSFARCTGFFGSLLLQNNGVVVMNHDGSQFAPV